MAIKKAKSAKEINEEIKAKRYPGAKESGDSKPKEEDAPVSAEDLNETGNDESCEEAAEAQEEETSEKE
jgi:hypothetical protein